MSSRNLYGSPVCWPLRLRPAIAAAALLALGLSYAPAADGGADEPKVLSVEAQLAQERAAIVAITGLGGWVNTRTIGNHEFVTEVNMVYHNTKERQRLDNQIVTDQALFFVPKFTHLKSLLLKETQASDEGLKRIRGMKHLERIYMWDASSVTDGGVAHLAALPKLNYIHLSQSRITDRALEHLKDQTQLEGLSLQGNHFTDEGLKHVRGLTNLKSLVLGLGKCKITDAGLIHLKDLRQLEQLGLQRSQVTDGGLRQLEGLKKLKSVWLSNTKVTDKGVAQLKEALPDVKVSQ